MRIEDNDDDDITDNDLDEVNVSSTSELLHRVDPVSQLSGNTHHMVDYFHLASDLRSGKIPNAPFPYRTYQSSGQVAFHLTRDPSSKQLSIDEVATKYKLTDL